MRLITPDIVKDEKKKNKDDVARRNHQLAVETARLTKELNDTRLAWAEDKVRIKKETEVYTAEQAEKRETLRKEVGTLEARKAAALEPVEEQRVFVEERHKTVTEEEQKLKQQRREFDLEYADFKTAKEAIGKWVVVFEKLEQSMVADEQKIAEDAQKTIDRKAALATEQTAFHVERESTKKELELAKIKNDNDAAANAIIKKGFDERDKELKSRERAVGDKYETLLKAIKHAASKGVII